jgi:hypothetical protein
MSAVSLGPNGSKKLIARASRDPEFRSRLIANPRDAIQAELGIELPAGFQVTVLEEKDRHGYVILPAAHEDAELNTAELELVAGGMMMNAGDCTCCFGSTSLRTTSAATCGEKC